MVYLLAPEITKEGVSDFSVFPWYLFPKVEGLFFSYHLPNIGETVNCTL